MKIVFLDAKHHSTHCLGKCGSTKPTDADHRRTDQRFLQISFLRKIMLFCETELYRSEL